MTYDTTVILGIPIDDLDLDETVRQVFLLADAFDADGRPRLAATVTTDTLIDLRAWTKNKKAAHALMNTLRRSDLLIPMGAPIAWAARILGIEMNHPINSDVFFEKILATAARRSKSIFLLGMKQSVITAMADRISKAVPEPVLAGIEVPSVRPDSSADEDTTEADLAGIERINGSGADLLFLDLSDPDLSQWFEKFRHRLFVPVTLVIPGTRTPMRGTRAPAAPDRNRTIRPWKVPFSRARHLWLRMYHGIFVFGLTIVPLILYQKYRQLLFRILHTRPQFPAISSAVSKSGTGSTLKIITMPEPMDASVIGDVKDEIKRMFQLAPKVVLDFSNVNFIDSSGLGLLLGLWRMAAAENREIFFIGVRSTVYRLFKLSRTLDFFESRMCDTIDDVLAILRQRANFTTFYYLAIIRGEAVLFHLFGELDAAGMIDLDIDALLEAIGDRNTILNLAGLNFIDSAGITLFVKIQRHISRHGKFCILCGLQEHVQQIFKIVRIDRLFTVTTNLAAAEIKLRRMKTDIRLS